MLLFKSDYVNIVIVNGKFNVTENVCNKYLILRNSLELFQD